jgi:hypothetical protein
MKTKQQKSNFTALGLFALLFISLTGTSFYFLAELHESEYLVYYAPILVILFYGPYNFINHSFDFSFLNGAYNDDSEES